LALAFNASSQVVSALTGVQDSIRVQTAEFTRAGSTPPLQVTIQGNVIGQREFADQIADIVMQKLRMQLVKV